MKKTKPFYKRSWFIVVAALFIIGTLGILFESDETKQERRDEELANQQLREEREEERDAKKILKEEEKEKQEKIEQEKKDREKAAAEEIAADPQRNLEMLLSEEVSSADILSIKGVFTEEPYTMQIELLGKENLTNKLTVSSFKLALLEAVYVVKESGYEINNLGISLKYPLVDKYGNESDEYVIKSDFSGETIQKLATDKNKIKRENLNIIADNWWEHPAISE